METEIIICVDCKQEFELTEENQRFFIKKGLQLPKRCESCRRKRKVADTEKSFNIKDAWHNNY